MPRSRGVVGELGCHSRGSEMLLEQLGRRLASIRRRYLLSALARVDAAARVGLELDRVGARLGGDVDQPPGDVEVAVVVGAGLGDHVGRRGRRRSGARRAANSDGRLIRPPSAAGPPPAAARIAARSASGPDALHERRGSWPGPPAVSRLSLTLRAGGSSRSARWGKRSGRSRTNGVTCSRSYGLARLGGGLLERRARDHLGVEPVREAARLARVPDVVEPLVLAPHPNQPVDHLGLRQRAVGGDSDDRFAVRRRRGHPVALEHVVERPAHQVEARPLAQLGDRVVVGARPRWRSRRRSARAQRRSRRASTSSVLPGPRSVEHLARAAATSSCAPARPRRPGRARPLIAASSSADHGGHLRDAGDVSSASSSGGTPTAAWRPVRTRIVCTPSGRRPRKSLLGSSPT